MSNDFEDDSIDFGDDSSDGGFEEFEGGGASLGDMWRNNPLVKIGVIAAGLATVIGAIILFGGSPTEMPPSQVRMSGGTQGTPGEEGISDVYRKAVEEENTQRFEQARRVGDSVIPTPIDPATTKLEVPEEEKVQEDPLERWRRIQEERRRQQGAPPAQPVVTNPHAEAIDALANAMAQQMQGILESQKLLEPEYINVADEEWLEGRRREEQEERDRLAREEGNGGGAGADGNVVDILIPAGTIEYAQLLIEANSDIEDGPVLAHLVSGPLAGSKMLGDFDVEDDYLVLNFDVLVIDGISHKIDAIALDPDTTLPAVATEVDQRYFSRVLLPAASEFISGFAEAVAQTSTTVVVTDGAAVSDTQELDTREEFFKGFEAAAEKVSEIIDEDASDIEPLIRVEAGTALGILFVDAVTEKTS